MGLVPDELEGAVVSNDFPAFSVDSKRLIEPYIGWLSRTRSFVESCRHVSEGTTNRVRLKEEKFYHLEIPLPSLIEQLQIVRKIEHLAAPATPTNEPAFEQWYQCGCCRADPSPLERQTIILAVRKNGTTASNADWSNLSAQGIYFQALEDGEGEQVVDAMNRLLLMVWDSRADLQAGIPPVLLRCRVRSGNRSAKGRAVSE